MSDMVLAIDIGGSKLSVGFVNLADGEITAHVTEAFSSVPTKEDVIHKIKALFAKLPTKVKFSAVGVTIPGLCDPDNGIWIYAPFSGIADWDIGEELRLYFNKKVYIENDVNACALAERAWGCCQNVRDFLWITVSNGCGGSLVLDGKLYTGFDNSAGEIGHYCVDYDTKRTCGCGNMGCLEEMASGLGIGKNYCELKGQKHELHIDGKYVATLAKKGDTTAKKAMDKAGEFLGRALAGTANITNPEKIVLGGSVCISYDLFKEELMKTFKKHAFSDIKNTTIEITTLGAQAAIKGAACKCFGTCD